MVYDNHKDNDKVKKILKTGILIQTMNKIIEIMKR
jgi:hypothetical protein